MDVTDVLRDRMQQPAGLQKMVTVSIALHAAIVAAVMFVPGGLLSHRAEPPTSIMTISLGGGSEGPRNGGLTPIGGAPVQAVAPPETKREAARPPAAKTPEMTIAAPTAKPVKSTTTPSPVKQAPDDARGRTPTRGTETAAGSSTAETGARGQGFGLSTGGGAGSGSYLDVANFCCPDYLITMIDRIRANWVRQAEISGNNIVKFTIHRDGTITDVELEKSSGFNNLDLASRRAMAVTRTLNPLPAEYPNPVLTVHLNFEYKR
jgi:TonB family protein